MAAAEVWLADDAVTTHAGALSLGCWGAVFLAFFARPGSAMNQTGAGTH
mgnify:CR=1 FL=1